MSDTDALIKGCHWATDGQKKIHFLTEHAKNLEAERDQLKAQCLALVEEVAEMRNAEQADALREIHKEDMRGTFTLDEVSPDGSVRVIAADTATWKETTAEEMAKACEPPKLDQLSKPEQSNSMNIKFAFSVFIGMAFIGLAFDCII